MPRSISLLLKNNILGLHPGLTAKEPLEVLEKIDKHLDVLHHRNSQLRNAIMANSEEVIQKRHQQFVTVLRSYVRLVIVDLHGKITEAMQFDEGSEYMEIRKETFEGYEELVVRTNLTCAEILDRGTDFGRELFQMELKLKGYQEIEARHIYPLYNQVCRQE